MTGIEELSPAAAGDAIGRQVAGYRLVRVLAIGSRAAIYLGHSGGKVTTTVAVKIFHDGTSRESISTEVEALSAIDHPHCVRLLDIGMTPMGVPCLVLDRPARGSASRLMSARQQLSSGEVVTLLAPVAQALAFAHSVGVVHGRVSLSSILLTAEGKPILASFGHASVAGPGVDPVTQKAAADAETERMRHLAVSLLNDVPDSATDLSKPGRFSMSQLADYLLESYSAEAIGHASVGQGSQQSVMARAASSLALSQRVATPTTPPAETTSWRAKAILLIENAPMESLRSHGSRLRGSLAVVRKRVWVAAATGLLSLLVGLMVVPSASSDRTDGSAADSAAGVPVPSAQPSAHADVTSADDPKAALSELLERRTRCVKELSVLCLDQVDQQGSAAAEHDVALIRGALQTEEEIPASSVADITERFGDTALVTFVTGGTILMIKTANGWRIRNYLIN